MRLEDSRMQVRDRRSGRHRDDDRQHGRDGKPERDKSTDAFVDADVQSEQSEPLILGGRERQRL
jgi:hypothetical protein